MVKPHHFGGGGLRDGKQRGHDVIMLMDWSTMTPDGMTTRFDAVLISTTGDLAPVLATAGGRMLRQLSWAETAVLATVTQRVVLMADLRDAGEIADTALDQIKQHNSYAACPIVAVLNTDQIDIAAALLGQGTQLLCEPSDYEIIAALTIAGNSALAIHDILGEGESARLQRLNEEVARIAEALSRLTKRDDAGPGAQDFRVSFDSGPSAVTIDASEIRRTIRARKLRDRQFGQALFEDPAWDMLLDLFAAELERAQVSVSSLCVAAGVAPTTALRWIGKLVDAGLFRREPDPFDRRRAFIALSERASAGMRSYVAAVRAAGLPIA